MLYGGKNVLNIIYQNGLGQKSFFQRIEEYEEQ